MCILGNQILPKFSQSIVGGSGLQTPNNVLPHDIETMLLSILVSERSIGLLTLLFLVSTDGIITFMKKLSGPSSRGQNIHFHNYFPIQLFMLSCSFFVLQNSVLWKLWRSSLTTKAIALLVRSPTVILFACRMVLQLVPFQRIFHLWWPFWCGESGCEQWGVWVRSTTL